MRRRPSEFKNVLSPLPIGGGRRRAQDFLILDAFLEPVWQLRRSRNAWHGYRSNNYFPGLGFSFVTEALAKAAESYRSKGSSLYLEEVPALCLVGIRRTLVGAVVNPRPDVLGYLLRGPLFALEITRQMPRADTVVWFDFPWPMASTRNRMPALRQSRSQMPRWQGGSLSWSEPQPRPSERLDELIVALNQIRRKLVVSHLLWTLVRQAYPEVECAPSDMSVRLEGEREHSLSVRLGEQISNVPISRRHARMLARGTKDFRYDWWLELP